MAKFVGSGQRGVISSGGSQQSSSQSAPRQSSNINAPNYSVSQAPISAGGSGQSGSQPTNPTPVSSPAPVVYGSVAQYEQSRAGLSTNTQPGTVGQRAPTLSEFTQQNYVARNEAQIKPYQNARDYQAVQKVVQQVQQRGGTPNVAGIQQNVSRERYGGSQPSESALQNSYAQQRANRIAQEQQAIEQSRGGQVQRTSLTVPVRAGPQQQAQYVNPLIATEQASFIDNIPFVSRTNQPQNNSQRPYFAPNSTNNSFGINFSSAIKSTSPGFTSQINGNQANQNKQSPEENMSRNMPQTNRSTSHIADNDLLVYKDLGLTFQPSSQRTAGVIKSAGQRSSTDSRLLSRLNEGQIRANEGINNFVSGLNAKAYDLERSGHPIKSTLYSFGADVSELTFKYGRYAPLVVGAIFAGPEVLGLLGPEAVTVGTLGTSALASTPGISTATALVDVGRANVVQNYYDLGKDPVALGKSIVPLTLNELPGALSFASDVAPARVTKFFSPGESKVLSFDTAETQTVRQSDAVFQATKQNVGAVGYSQSPFQKVIGSRTEVSAEGSFLTKVKLNPVGDTLQGTGVTSGDYLVKNPRSSRLVSVRVQGSVVQQGDQSALSFAGSELSKGSVRPVRFDTSLKNAGDYLTDVQSVSYKGTSFKAGKYLPDASNNADVFVPNRRDSFGQGVRQTTSILDTSMNTPTVTIYEGSSLVDAKDVVYIPSVKTNSVGLSVNYRNSAPRVLVSEGLVESGSRVSPGDSGLVSRKAPVINNAVQDSSLVARQPKVPNVMNTRVGVSQDNLLVGRTGSVTIVEDSGLVRTVPADELINAPDFRGTVERSVSRSLQGSRGYQQAVANKYGSLVESGLVNLGVVSSVIASTRSATALASSQRSALQPQSGLVSQGQKSNLVNRQTQSSSLINAQTQIPRVTQRTRSDTSQIFASSLVSGGAFGGSTEVPPPIFNPPNTPEFPRGRFGFNFNEGSGRGVVSNFGREGGRYTASLLGVESFLSTGFAVRGNVNRLPRVNSNPFAVFRPVVLASAPLRRSGLIGRGPRGAGKQRFSASRSSLLISRSKGGLLA